MLFGVMQQHHGEYLSGLYFDKYPELPLEERGRYFKYKNSQHSKQMDDIITNLAHEAVQKTIVSTYGLPWKPEAYVLLGDELWRIASVSATPINEQSAALCKAYQKEYSITIRKVANAIGMQR
jgi:hypothetical protein